MANKYSPATLARVSSLATMIPQRVGMILSMLEQTQEQRQLRLDAEAWRAHKVSAEIINRAAVHLKGMVPTIVCSGCGEDITQAWCSGCTNGKDERN